MSIENPNKETPYQETLRKFFENSRQKLRSQIEGALNDGSYDTKKIEFLKMVANSQNLSGDDLSIIRKAVNMELGNMRKEEKNSRAKEEDKNSGTISDKEKERMMKGAELLAKQRQKAGGYEEDMEGEYF